MHNADETGAHQDHDPELDELCKIESWVNLITDSLRGTGGPKFKSLIKALPEGWQREQLELAKALPISESSSEKSRALGEIILAKIMNAESLLPSGA